MAKYPNYESYIIASTVSQLWERLAWQNNTIIVSQKWKNLAAGWPLEHFGHRQTAEVKNNQTTFFNQHTDLNERYIHLLFKAYRESEKKLQAIAHWHTWKSLKQFTWNSNYSKITTSKIIVNTLL